jgi:hypothetical protein
MRDFKFFEDNEEEWEGASWMWRRIPTRSRFEIVIEEHYGIHSFLSQFPSHEIISVHAIVGPNGFVHNRQNDGVGWGFDITRDLIKVTWIRYLE